MKEHIWQTRGYAVAALPQKGSVAVAAVACVGVVSLQENNQPAADADGVTVAEQTSTEGVSIQEMLLTPGIWL